MLKRRDDCCIHNVANVRKKIIAISLCGVINVHYIFIYITVTQSYKSEYYYFVLRSL